MRQKGGLEYAQKRMLEYKQMAEKLLDEIPTIASTEYLKTLVDYVIDRKK